MSARSLKSLHLPIACDVPMAGTGTHDEPVSQAAPRNKRLPTMIGEIARKEKIRSLQCIVNTVVNILPNLWFINKFVRPSDRKMFWDALRLHDQSGEIHLLRKSPQPQHWQQFLHLPRAPFSIVTTRSPSATMSPLPSRRLSSPARMKSGRPGSARAKR